MSTYTDMQRFITDLEGSSVFKNWCKQHSGDCATWEAYRAALMANQGQPPAAPAMSTPFGKSLIDAGIMALDGGLVVPPPQPPPPPPPAPGTILFDGRATQMTALSSHRVSSGGNIVTPLGQFQTIQTPSIWDCICFGNGSGDNIKLVADGHYTQVFEVTTRIGDTNQWGGNTGGSVNGAAEMSKRRTLHTDLWTWFAVGAMVPSWNGSPSDIAFCEVGSFGYQTSASSQVALDIYGDGSGLHWAIFQNAGYGYNPSGWARGSVSYETPFLDITLGVWEEFVIGVKAATDDTGEVQVWHRPQGGSWDSSPIFDHHGATEFYGVASGNTFPQNIDGQGIIDKCPALYYGNESQTVNQQTIKETGMVVCSDLATAQLTFP